MRGVLLNAAQSSSYKCLSPLAVLDEIEALCQSKAEYEWLQQDPLAGGYHDVSDFRTAIFGRLLDAWEEELYRASSFIDEERYAELFDRYVHNVSVWVKKERIRNRVTGEYEEPDEKLMKEVERLLDTTGSADEARKQMISSIAAWALDHPGQRVAPAVVFPHFLQRMREGILGERRPAVARLTRDLVVLVRENAVSASTVSGGDTPKKRWLAWSSSVTARNCAADAASATPTQRDSTTCPSLAIPA